MKKTMVEGVPTKPLPLRGEGKGRSKMYIVLEILIIGLLIWIAVEAYRHIKEL